MSPYVIQINVSAGGVPKTPVPVGHVTFTRIEGDDWNDKRYHGRPGQAVCLFSLELIEELKQEGFPLFPGALGENITTSGLDFRDLRIGDMLTLGPDVEVRITKIRVPCRTITVYGQGIIRATYDERVKAGDVHSPKWGRSGFYAEVLREGLVHPLDPIGVRHQVPSGSEAVHP